MRGIPISTKRLALDLRHQPLTVPFGQGSLIHFVSWGFHRELLFVDIASALLRRVIFLQKVCDTRNGVNLVFQFGKSVALVFIDLQLHHTSAFLDRAGYLFGFGAWAARIIAETTVVVR